MKLDEQSLYKVKLPSVSNYMMTDRDLAARVTSSKNLAGFVASSNTNYKTSFSAVYACDNAAKAFNVALGELINSIVTHPDFPKTI
jgi:transcription termination factor Rho